MVESHFRHGVKFLPERTRLGLTSLFLLGFELESLVASHPFGAIQLENLGPCYAGNTGRALRYDLYGCSSLEQLLTEQLSLFFVLENTETRSSSKAVKLRTWPDSCVKQQQQQLPQLELSRLQLSPSKPQAASPSTAGERDEEKEDAAKLESNSRITPDIIGHVLRKDVKTETIANFLSLTEIWENRKESVPVPGQHSVKPFKIEPTGTTSLGWPGKQAAVSPTYGRFFPHSPQGSKIRFEKTMSVADSTSWVVGDGGGSCTEENNKNEQQSGVQVRDPVPY